MQLTRAFVHDVTEHIKTYLVAGTLAAVGLDVVNNVESSMGGAMAGVDMMAALSVPGPLALLVRGVGVALLVMGLALYAANMWCGFRALRDYRFRFENRGVVLQACGWSAAFLYVLGSLAIGASVNAVYLALVR